MDVSFSWRQKGRERPFSLSSDINEPTSCQRVQGHFQFAGLIDLEFEQKVDYREVTLLFLQIFWRTN